MAYIMNVAYIAGKYTLASVAVALVLLYSMLSVFQRLFFVPPLHYKKKIKRAIDGSGRLYKSKLGLKMASFRRRVILGSVDPSSYSVTSSNKNVIELAPIDVSNGDAFLEATSPKQVIDGSRKIIFGFFHPYCNAGGGGERVLWQAVHATLEASQNYIVAIYTGDKAEKEEILALVKQRFGLKFANERIVFIYLSKRYLVDGSYWKTWTLLGQAIGSVYLAFEAINTLPPDVFLDTMGYPFAYPLVYHLLKIPILSYTHFPIIQKEMLGKLSGQITKNSSLLGKVKLMVKYFYWQLFIIVYGFLGYYVDIPLCNGSWTFNHLNSIWWMLDGTRKDDNVVKLRVLYPPCSTEQLVDKDSIVKPKTTWNKQDWFVCLAQFRPEKRHSLILTEYSKFLSDATRPTKLVLIGSTRTEQDLKFVEELRALTKELKISENVEFVLDAPFETVKEYFAKCSYSINAMWNEHFGIAVVEAIAAGLIPINHASAGPLLDIAVPWDVKEKKQSSDESNKIGFFFKSPQDPDYVKTDYPGLATCFSEVMELSDAEKIAMSVRGKSCVLEKFSNETFESDWDKNLGKLVKYETYFRERKGKVEQVY